MLEVQQAGRTDFLAEEHTLRYMHTEFAPNTISDREHREAWAAAGAQDTAARANQRAVRLLNEHQPRPIDPAIDRQLRQRFPHLQAD